MPCPTLLKFYTLVNYRSLEAAELSKSTSGQILDGQRRPDWTCLKRSNSAADYSISLKFGSGCIMSPRSRAVG